MLDKQPLYIKGVDDSDKGATNCYLGGKGLIMLHDAQTNINLQPCCILFHSSFQWGIGYTTKRREHRRHLLLVWEVSTASSMDLLTALRRNRIGRNLTISVTAHTQNCTEEIC